MSSLSTSMFGAGSIAHTDNDGFDFDRTNQQYEYLKANMHYENTILDKNNSLLMGMM